MSDDYRDEPISLGERRAEKTNSSMDISPREMLVNILRQIDDGTLKPEKMIAVMTVTDGDETHVFSSQTKTWEMSGLAMEVIR